MQGELIRYETLSKQGKRQIITFIRKVYNCTQIHIKDIVSNRYQALLHEGKLIGVSFRL
jgi:hypothetical protein